VPPGALLQSLFALVQIAIGFVVGRPQEQSEA
jgi:hypothetical protein